MKKYQNFLSENFHFLVVKFSVYLNRHVFVMGVLICSSSHLPLVLREGCASWLWHFMGLYTYIFVYTRDMKNKYTLFL